MQANREPLGLTLTVSTLHIVVLDTSPLFNIPLDTARMLQRTSQLINVLVRMDTPLVPYAPPSAILVLFHILTERDGRHLLRTSAGRLTLRSFIVGRLFP